MWWKILIGVIFGYFAGFSTWIFIALKGMFKAEADEEDRNYH